MLYHVALIEADWLFDDLFGIPLDDSEVAAWFPETTVTPGANSPTFKANHWTCTCGGWRLFVSS